MIWVDRLAKQIKARNRSIEWVDDMKTPSGRIHVGSLLGVVYHDLLYKALAEEGIDTKFTYVFEDHDPMDGMPSYLDPKKWEKYMGMQLYKIPSPEAGYENFAKYFALEFQEVFERINCHPKIIWMSQYYLQGKMNEVVKTALGSADKIRQIYAKHTKRELGSDWYPFNVECEKCGKIGTTKVYDWDGRQVSYRCLPEMVAWAKGCGHQGKRSPYDGSGKLPWKVEWPAKWKVIGVTVEGAGKDHMSAGGSHDISSEISEKVFEYPTPFAFAYEWFTIGGKKMSSSKGVGSSAKEVSHILPAELLRFLIVRTPANTHLDFDPVGETIPNLFDEYDRCLNAYFDKLENKVPEGKQGEVVADLARIMHFSFINNPPTKRIYLPRFRTIVNVLKTKGKNMSLDYFKNYFEKIKGSSLTSGESEVLLERIQYAGIYMQKYMQNEQVIELSDKPISAEELTSAQIKFLKELGDLLVDDLEDRDALQTRFFNLMSKNNLSPKDVFPLLYKILIGKQHGPKIADLILILGKEKVRDRIEGIT